MAMELTQVRLPTRLIQEVERFVKKGHYSSKSDLIRNAIRSLINLEKQVGSIPNTGDSVKEVREIRNKLSKEKFNLDEINALGK